MALSMFYVERFMWGGGIMFLQSDEGLKEQFDV